MQEQEIREKIKREYLEKFRPIAEDMAARGADEDAIVGFFQKQVELKTRHFYEGQKKKPESLKDIFKGIRLEDLTQGNEDSKAEAIFCRMLVDNDIKYKLQVEIGPFRADYLIGDYIVIELDGPQHDPEKDQYRDAYLKRLGYKTIRIPLWLLTVEPVAVMEAIKEAVNG